MRPITVLVALLGIALILLTLWLGRDRPREDARQARAADTAERAPDLDRASPILDDGTSEALAVERAPITPEVAAKLTF